MATSGTVTIAATSSIKDVAGNALTGTLSRSSTGTKRIIGVNGGGGPNVSWGQGSYYAPPFIADNGFQGNEANPLLTFTSQMAGHNWFSGTPDTSGVTDPAPNAVYQTARVLFYSTQDMIYSIPVDSGTYKLRLHFCQNYVNTVGDQVFHIYVNGSLAWSNFDILAQTGGQMHKAYIAEFNNVSPVNGTVTVTLDPQPTSLSGATLNGIEIVKP
jgi:hypothetical protein